VAFQIVFSSIVVDIYLRSSVILLNFKAYMNFIIYSFIFICFKRSVNGYTAYRYRTRQAVLSRHSHTSRHVINGDNHHINYEFLYWFQGFMYIVYLNCNMSIFFSLYFSLQFPNGCLTLPHLCTVYYFHAVSVHNWRSCMSAHRTMCKTGCCHWVKIDFVASCLIHNILVEYTCQHFLVSTGLCL
jgi:hypothetical protein